VTTTLMIWMFQVQAGIRSSHQPLVALWMHNGSCCFTFISCCCFFSA
jgi:hypothetical protein